MTPSGAGEPVDVPELIDAPPDKERTIADVETLRALSDPLRLKLLESMVKRVDPPWTVKELAGVLKVPTTRLYHHIDQLLERELIRPVERRIVSGIIETRYRVAALSLRLDRNLFSGGTPEADAAVHEVLLSLFDGARDELEASLRANLVDTSDDAEPARRFVLSKGFARLAPDRIVEFRQRLVALLEEYQSVPDAEDGLDFGLLVAFYPVGVPTDEPGAGPAPHDG